MKRFLLTALVAMTVLLPSSAFAYNYTYPCGPTWTNLPVKYWINSAGSGDLPFSTVESIVASSFDAWSAPCCSRFAVDYRGTTSYTATNNQGNVVLSWVEGSNQWDPQWGSVNQTIGITLMSVWNDCSYAEAPIVFNGIGFRFTNGGGGTDLQSIATHEIGHMLGLGHSSVGEATMYYQYSGGTGARSLHQDDVNGVCSLYTRSCSCTSSVQCTNGEQCIGGQCKVPPCNSNSECDAGLECNRTTGACGLPSCTSDANCASGFTCQGNVCVSGCDVCRRGCSGNDCGANGACVDDGAGGTFCAVFCVQGGVCPGDAECYPLTSGDYACGSPDPNVQELCPSNYVCGENTVTNNCTTASDCPAGQFCENTTEGRRCVVPDDPCADVTCGAGLVCRNGLCYQEDISNNGTGANNTPGNNTPGNNTPGNNTPGNNTPGNNGTGGNDEDPVIIVFAADDDTGEGCCAVTKPRDVPGAALLAMLGLLLVRRRRR